MLKTVKFAKRVLTNAEISLGKIFLFEKRNIDLCYQRALSWIKNNTIPEKGIVANSIHTETCHVEVTGYLIPTLIDAGELGLARQYACFLSSVQRSSGAFAARDGKEYVFDSGQALRGLVAASKIWPQFKPFAAKTANYIVSLIKENGRILPMYIDSPESIHVFILPALVGASEVTGEQKYAIAAKKSLQYYINDPDVLDGRFLTHDLGYIIDGFIDMKQADFICSLAKEVFSRQSPSGKISAYPSVLWSCSAGVAQFAVIGYKLGMKIEADKAINYLCRMQNYSGGFYGSYGIFGKYFNDAEIGWANKFFIDAVHLKASIEN